MTGLVSALGSSLGGAAGAGATGAAASGAATGATAGAAGSAAAGAAGAGASGSFGSALGSLMGQQMGKSIGGNGQQQDAYNPNPKSWAPDINSAPQSVPQKKNQTPLAFLLLQNLPQLTSNYGQSNSGV